MSQLDFHGRSMFPLIREGSQLDVHFYSEPKPLQDIEVGQVVLLKEASEWVAHRVVQKGDIKVTKGDWSMPFDEMQWAWGEVNKVNGHSSSLLASPYLSELSVQVSSQQSSLRRKFSRIKILFYVLVNQWFRRGV